LHERLHTWLQRRHLEHGRWEFAFSIALGTLLAFGALAGVAWVADFDALQRLLARPDWVWFPVALGAETAAYLGYTLAYREIARVEGGRPLSLTRLLAVVTSGFGMFIPRGGFAADYCILVESGFSPPQARLRVLGLGALEYAILAPAACATSIFLLTDNAHIPLSLTMPWAATVPLGFALAVAFVGRRGSWRSRGGWRGRAANGLDAVAILQRLAAAPREHGISAATGMGLYWAGDIVCLWACLRGFLGHPPSVAALLIGYATGYALTRRTLPLAGAGPVEALLPFTLSWVSIPLAPALLAVLVYRAFNLWLPLLPALAGHRTILRGSAETESGPY
jgi:uncharacterized membrane protein YbhN (UPF0104 family)